MEGLQVRRKAAERVLVLTLLGGVTLSSGAWSAPPVDGRAEGQPQVTWLSFEGDWLCRSWGKSQPVDLRLAMSGGAAKPSTAMNWEVDAPRQRALGQSAATTTRCTLRWHIDAAGRLTSDDSAWTPNPTGEWPSFGDPTPLRSLSGTISRRDAVTRAAPAGRAVRTSRRLTTAAPRTSGSSGGSGGAGGGAPSGAYNSWAPVPGHPAYRMSDFAGDPYTSYFGYCTWYVWYRNQGKPLMQLGSAASWAANAPSRGFAVGRTPRAGAVAVFQPGVEGAGANGHVAVVEQVLSGGWFIVSEMNFGANGGGWGRVDWRYAYVTGGVSFIY